MRPLGKVNINWSPEFAYAIGLLVTDGSLSKDGRHISFTSKDLELVENLNNSLNTDFSIGKKANGTHKIKKYFVIQIGDVLFYRFLLQIGLMPNKTKIIKDIKIPDKYIFDFLRGHLDGDGSFYSYWDKRWKSSFMFYTVFVSASKEHVDWIKDTVFKLIGVRGNITTSKNTSVYQLKYAKAGSLKLLPKLFYNKKVVCLTRKRFKIEQVLESIGATM